MAGKEEQDKLRGAARSRREITRIVDQGKGGAKVFIPLDQAPFVFLLNADVLGQLRNRQQSLGISVEKENPVVVVELKIGGRERKEGYRRLYALVQLIQTSRAPQFFETGGDLPEVIYEDIPGLRESLALVKAGIPLPDEELVALQLRLYAFSLAFGETASGLPDPLTVLQNVGVAR